jgi:tetratricopeptide (TPR) repeat protein
MNNAINELVRSIVKKNSLAECSVSELQRLTTQYPYFGPVQFLLARKLKDENSTQYAKQSQKAILYFQDDLWFDYVTSSRLNEVVFSKNTMPAEALPVQPLMATQETTAETAEETEAVPEPVVVEEKLPVPAIQLESDIETAIEDLPHSEEKEDRVVEVIQQPEENPESPVEIVESSEPAIEAVDIVEEISETAQPVIHEKAPIEYDDGSSYSSQPEIKDLPPLPAFKIEAFNPETAKLSFEPYHTVDYFASLGIKFREEEKPKDKFSQQLKSFTEWLKTLKKVPETTGGSAPTATGPEDKKVTQLAAHSLAEDAVVTEAMADVWEKQGNHEKAIETYRKLSLLNPSKSAYFAAKIDHLKQL